MGLHILSPTQRDILKRLSLNYSHGGLQSLMHSEGSVRALETVDVRRPRCLGSCLHKGGLCAWDLEPLTTAAACERGKRFFALLPLLISFSLEFAFQLLFVHREALCPHCQPWLLGLPGNVLYTYTGWGLGVPGSPTEGSVLRGLGGKGGHVHCLPALLRPGACDML